MHDIECPYCGHEQDVCQDDGHACEDGAMCEEQCESCEKMFALTPSISFCFSVRKADCMNSGVHDWTFRTRRDSDGYRYRRCRDCEKSEYIRIAEKAA